jgi:hypothetical protein
VVYQCAILAFEVSVWRIHDSAGGWLLMHNHPAREPASSRVMHALSTAAHKPGISGYDVSGGPRSLVGSAVKCQIVALH